jgi:hypothetical protein
MNVRWPTELDRLEAAYDDECAEFAQEPRVGPELIAWSLFGWVVVIAFALVIVAVVGMVV